TNGLAEDGTILIVGDVKQAIYRWRDGKAELLMKDVQKELAAFWHAGAFQNLENNWRSAPEIVAFNNLFFETASQTVPFLSETHQKVYQSVRQIPQKTNLKGKVEVRFFSFQDWHNQKQKWTFQESWIVQEIHNCITAGFKLGDICIIVRTNQEANFYKHVLAKNNILAVSAASLEINQTNEVQLLLCLIRWYLKPNHLLTIAELNAAFLHLYQPYTTIKNPDYFFTSTSKDNLFEFLPEEWSKVREELAGISIYEGVESLIRLFRLTAQGRNVAAVVRFLEAIQDFSSTEGGSYQQFLEWWNENQANYTTHLPESQETVKIMTVHKSKGLEFPAVLIPFLNWDTESSYNEILWLHSELEPYQKAGYYPVKYDSLLEKTDFKNQFLQEKSEKSFDYLNLLYVAFTRAKERLTIGVELPHKPTETSVSGWIQAILQTPECKHFQREPTVWVWESQSQSDNSRQEDNNSKPFHQNTITELAINQNRKWITVVPQAQSYFLELETGQMQAAKRGILIHEILSQIQRSADVDSKIREKITHGLMSENEGTEIVHSLKQLFNIPEIYSWFDGTTKVLTEQAILTPSGKRYKPDRVLIYPNQTAKIIDYKTGNPEPSHQTQIRIYANLIQAMGYQCQAFLLYIKLENTNPVELVEVLLNR
ncbi:MAG: PD-(D/E)XK nuclease family protein, partial [Bacteroidia bacterium]|nr:PD-(D/E)XK nuclease family protein [Bacteroidia bacterium]